MSARSGFFRRSRLARGFVGRGVLGALLMMPLTFAGATILLPEASASASCLYNPSNGWVESVTCYNSQVQAGVFTDSALAALNNGGYGSNFEGVMESSGSGCYDTYQIGVASGLPHVYGQQGAGYAVVDAWSANNNPTGQDDLYNNISANGAGVAFQINYEGPDAYGGEWLGQYYVSGGWHAGAYAYDLGYGACESYVGGIYTSCCVMTDPTSAGTWDFNPMEWQETNGTWVTGGWGLNYINPACTPSHPTDPPYPQWNGVLYSSSFWADNLGQSPC